MSWQCAAPLHPISLYLVSTLCTILWYQITPSKGRHWVEAAKALLEGKVNVHKGKERPTAHQYFTHVTIICHTWICISAAIPPPHVRVRYPCEQGGSFFLLVNLFLLEETGWKRKLKCYGNTHSISSQKHILFGNQTSGAIQRGWSGRKSANIQNLQSWTLGLFITPLHSCWGNVFYLLETQHHVMD